MTAKHPYPGISTDGWVSSSLSVADQLLLDFFLSEYSQTANFKEGVSSFPWIIQQFKEDPNRLASVLQNVISNYFSKYFFEVEVDVVSEPYEESINYIILKFFLKFKDKAGEEFSLAKLLKHDGLKIIELSNYLTGTQE